MMHALRQARLSPVLRLFSALALVAAALLLPACATDSIEDRQYGQQVVCHNGKTLAVSNADSFVHLDHGDAPGPCPGD
jgi:hypothetical protein